MGMLYSTCFRPCAGDFRTLSTQEKEGFIERVDIVSLSRMICLFRRKRSQNPVEAHTGKSMWRKGGNSWPLFLIAFKKAVRV
jgi:hypothetical protein